MTLDLSPTRRIRTLNPRNAAAWAAAAGFLALDPCADNVHRLLVAAAVTLTLQSALRRRDERFCEWTRIAFWAGTVSRDDHLDAP
jgi:hypothetical protein